MSYFSFLNYIDIDEINVIFELGSRDLIDGIRLMDHFYNSKVYSFECNPDSLIECNKQLKKIENEKKRIVLVDKAVSLVDGIVTFYPFDLTKYDNMGASSMLKIDFSLQGLNTPNPQNQINVVGTRLDTFMDENNIDNVDLICIDLQGYELNALKSLGEYLHKVKYIITECSIQSTYIDGANFVELNEYLNKYNFIYASSNRFGDSFPNTSLRGYSEFDAIFINLKFFEKL